MTTTNKRTANSRPGYGYDANVGIKHTAKKSAKAKKPTAFERDVKAGAEIARNAKLLQKFKVMLLATTEAIEHYADGERKNDPIVKAHAALTTKARKLLAES